jgi:hypothetical protein
MLEPVGVGRAEAMTMNHDGARRVGVPERPIGQQSGAVYAMDWATGRNRVGNSDDPGIV